MSVGKDSACLGLHVTVYMLQLEGGDNAYTANDPSRKDQENRN